MIVDLVEKLIDRLVQLLQLRQERKDDFEAEYVDGICSAITEVHEAYADAFQQIYKMISDDKPIEDVIRWVEEKRLSTEGQRLRLREIVYAMSTSDHERYEQFYVLVYEYLTSLAIHTAVEFPRYSFPKDDRELAKKVFAKYSAWRKGWSRGRYLDELAKIVHSDLMRDMYSPSTYIHRANAVYTPLLERLQEVKASCELEDIIAEICDSDPASSECIERRLVETEREHGANVKRAARKQVDVVLFEANEHFQAISEEFARLKVNR